MSEPAEYNLDAHHSGDTWAGVSSITLDITGLAGSPTLTSVRMQVRDQSRSRALALELSTTGGEITILNAATGESQIPARIISLDPKSYDYQIEYTLSDGSVYTLLKGLWTITRDGAHS